MSARGWYSIRAAAGGEAEILIYDAIGGLDGITAKQFAKDLKALGSPKQLTLRINSPGGDVFDAAAIYNQLKRHSARKVVTIDGLAASAASVIAMAGDEIVMPENSMMMIHDPMGVVIGGAQDMRDFAEALDKVKDTLVAAYRRCGQDDKDIARMMAAETWLTAAEAVAAGLADRTAEPVKAAAAHDLGRFRYRHPPQPSPADAWGRVISARFPTRQVAR